MLVCETCPQMFIKFEKTKNALNEFVTKQQNRFLLLVVKKFFWMIHVARGFITSKTQILSQRVSKPAGSRKDPTSYSFHVQKKLFCSIDLNLLLHQFQITRYIKVKKHLWCTYTYLCLQCRRFLNTLQRKTSWTGCCKK